MRKAAALGIVAVLAVLWFWPKLGKAGTQGQGGSNGPSPTAPDSCGAYIDPETGLLTIQICGGAN